MRLAHKRDVAILPGVNERDHVVRVPRSEEATLPICAQEVLERGILAIHQVPVLAEPLCRRHVRIAHVATEKQVECARYRLTVGPRAVCTTEGADT